MSRLLSGKKEILEGVIRNKVFDCACDILKQDGLNGMTMDKLAACVGVAKGTLYNYFENKNDVLVFLNNRVANEVAEQNIAMMQREPDSRKVLWMFVMGFFEGLEKFSFLHYANVDLGIGHSSLDCNMEALQKLRASVVTLMQRGIKDGSFREGSPELMEIMLSSIMYGISHTTEICRVGKNGASFTDIDTRERLTREIMSCFCKQ